jgi:hypothetical protein
LADNLENARTEIVGAQAQMAKDRDQAESQGKDKKSKNEVSWKTSIFPRNEIHESIRLTGAITAEYGIDNESPPIDVEHSVSPSLPMVVKNDSLTTQETTKVEDFPSIAPEAEDQKDEDDEEDEDADFPTIVECGPDADDE